MYSTIDIKKTNKLYLVRHGWFKAEYELTDNIVVYGKLTYGNIFRFKGVASTANNVWTFKREGIFNPTILITDPNDTITGKATRDFFSRTTVLALETGFKAQFSRPSVWLWDYIWESAGYGKIIRIHSPPLSLQDTVYIDQSMTPPALIPLLILLGAHLTILSRRRKGAHY